MYVPSSTLVSFRSSLFDQSIGDAGPLEPGGGSCTSLKRVSPSEATHSSLRGITLHLPTGG
jgi:hypothetical protein